jgi:hypothetical protein
LLEFCDGTPRKTLFDRRPDLQYVELTCENTEKTLPYIDLVNEILEGLVHAPVDVITFALPDTVPSVFDAAAGGNATAITKIRDALAGFGYVLTGRTIVTKSALDKPSAVPPVREWVILDDAWRFSVRQQVTTGPWFVQAWPQTSSKSEALEVFPEHFNAFTYTVLSQTVFPFNLPLDLGREEIEIFLKAKHVRPHEVREAFSVLDPSSKLESETIALSYLRLTSNEAGAILGEGQLARATGKRCSRSCPSSCTEAGFVTRNSSICSIPNSCSARPPTLTASMSRRPRQSSCSATSTSFSSRT